MKRRLTVFFKFSAAMCALLLQAACASSPATPARIKPLSVSAPIKTQEAVVAKAPDNARKTVQPTSPIKDSTSISADVFNLHNDALVSIKKSDWVSAELKLLRLIEMQPSLTSPYANLGAVYIEKKQYTEAERMLSEAVSKNKKNAQIYNLLGVAYRQQGKFKEAENAYNEAISIDGNYSAAYYNLGVLYDLYLSNYQSAAKYYQRYAQMEPNEEKKIAGWIMDMQKRAQVSN